VTTPDAAVAPLSLPEQLRHQARHCAEFGSPLYADLLARCADDVEAGGAVARLLASRADLPPQQVLPLRLLGGVHALVLQRRAHELAMFYPSVGGTATDAEARWHAFCSVVTDQADALQPWLDATVQTNEPGRAAALLGALHAAGVRAGPLPVRLFEFGASAGLNLRVDALPIGPGATIDTPLPPPVAPLRVAERQGADLHPIDPTTTDGRLRLTAYVWADDRPRLERLRLALDIAAQVSAPVARSGAAEFLAEVGVRPGFLTVVWHSIVWQYLPTNERAAVIAELDRLAREASDEAPVAHVSLEPDPDAVGRSLLLPEVRLRLAPQGVDSVLGVAPAHGVPVQWRPDLLA
jgi:hypothetical protein